jgi:hypothetical protein
MNVSWVLLFVKERTPTRSPVSTTVAGSSVSEQTEDGQLFGSGSSSVAEKNTSTTVLLPVPVIVAPNQSNCCTAPPGSVHEPTRFWNTPSSTYSQRTLAPVTCTS